MRLGESIDARRSTLFVGRAAELARLDDWLAGADAETTVWVVAGMGGIGKSALVSEMLRRGAASGARTHWMDGYACDRSPLGFLDYVRSLLDTAPASGARELAEHLAPERGRRARTLIAVDNFDELTGIAGWLRESFLAHMPDRGVLVLLACRQADAAGWLADAAWRRRVVSLSLPPFTRDEARAYLAHCPLGDRGAGESLIRAAAGHPLALAVGVEAVQRDSTFDASTLAGDVSARLLREVAAPFLHPLLEALSVVREADQDLLAQMLHRDPTPGEYHGLARLSFVRPSARGLVLHDTARGHLLTDLRRRSPARLATLRRRAVATMRDRLSTAATRYERRAIGAGLLTLCRDALPSQGGFIDLTAEVDLDPPSSGRAQDRVRLHAILDASARRGQVRDELEAEHDLLDDLLQGLPECVRVVRSARGEPLAFLTVVPLYRTTAALVERYALGALYLRHCSREERAALDVEREATDTYIALVGGGAADRPDYTVGELACVLFSDAFAFLGEGVRLLMPTNYPDHQTFLGRLGFMPRPDCGGVLDGEPDPFLVMELDLRRRDFGAWVASFLHGGGESHPRAVPPAALHDPEAASSRGRLPVHELEAALTVVAHPERLAVTQLAQVLGCGGHRLQDVLVSCLTASSPPAPLTPAEQEILRVAFLRTGPARSTAEAKASSLFVSRATFYRRRRSALSTLGAALPGLVEVGGSGTAVPYAGGSGS